MARPLRIQYPNALYHVMNRGADKQWIYQNESHRYLFLSLLEEASIRYRVEIHAYCLMGNHYHLLVKTPLANLDQVMRHINGVYTQHYNQLMNRDGPLFRGRYRACLIEIDNYLVQVSRYIHLNPVTAKLCKKAEDYYWSSYKYFLGINQSPAWLNTRDTLQYFGNTDQHHHYRCFIEHETKNEEVELVQKIKKSPILGSDVFIKHITEHFLQEAHQIPEIPMHKKLPITPSLQEIRDAVIKYFKITDEDLWELKPKMINFPRLITIYLAVKLTHEKSQAIGKAFGDISGNAVTQIHYKLKKRLASDEKLKMTISNIEKELRT